jgi:DNA-binding protein H-NS
MTTQANLAQMQATGAAHVNYNARKALLEQRDALAAQQAELAKQLEEHEAAAKAEAIASIKTLMAEHGIKAADLVDADSKASKAPRKGGSGAKVAPKFRDPATGKTWTGRGLQPKWVDREAMRIAA